jgi:hypothetical protein
MITIIAEQIINIYILFWARIMISVYNGVAYHNASFRQIKKRFVALGK